MACDGLPDWRDGEAYRWLSGADRTCFAWEWLRRDEAYRRGFSENAPPSGFGLHAMVDPALDGRTSRPVWRRAIDRSVLVADVEAAGCDLFELGRVARFATIVTSAEGEHILLSDGLRSVRFDLLSGSVRSGPVALRWQLAGLWSLMPALTALRQLIALAGSGAFSASLHPRERRAPRWIATLRVRDARAAGATAREMARELFGEAVVGASWRVDAASYRLRIQRLVALSRQLSEAGPGVLLDS
ncbi:MAG: hypothetical protein JWN66_2612 [Sphingomonas bacterium]|nr:hypothetical protein [Sphingomonas bacterium]